MPTPTSEVQNLLDTLDALGTPPLSSIAVERARREIEALLTTHADAPDLATVADTEIDAPGGTVPLRAYYPTDATPLPVLLYFHGGGWISGSLDTHDDLCRELAAAVPCAVVSVGYHLAPEAQFPVPVRDAFTALQWTAAYADDMGFDGDRIAVGGDSAGGNLAVAVALLARDRDGPSIVHQALAYPALDHAFDTASYDEVGDRFLLTRDSVAAYWEYYLRSPLDGYNVLASPLRSADLSGLPPATVITCELDPLRSEGREFARRLREADTPVTETCFEGTIHAFLSFDELSARERGISLLASGLAEAFD